MPLAIKGLGVAFRILEGTAVGIMSQMVPNRTGDSEMATATLASRITGQNLLENKCQSSRTLLVWGIQQASMAQALTPMASNNSNKTGTMAATCKGQEGSCRCNNSANSNKPVSPWAKWVWADHPRKASTTAHK